MTPTANRASAQMKPISDIGSDSTTSLAERLGYNQEPQAFPSLAERLQPISNTAQPNASLGDRIAQMRSGYTTGYQNPLEFNRDVPLKESPMDRAATPLKYQRQSTPKSPHEAFIAATVGQESGGDYNARSGKDSKGREAYGKYQVMDFNIPSWTKQFYGRELTPEEFLADKQAQDAVGRGRLKELFDKYGIEDGASYYFSGGPLSKNANKKDKNGKTVREYVNDIKRRYQQELSSGNMAFSGKMK